MKIAQQCCQLHKMYTLSSYIVLTLALASPTTARSVLQSDAGLSPPQMLQNHGYPSEVHYITTEDHYINTVHRIPNSKKTPVLVYHGIFSSSADFLNAGPTRSLGYILADAGYDVWLANARGNIFSRNHTTLNAQNPAFFDFSWHEIGYFDLPAIIDYILGLTGEKQLQYMGHSQGCTIFLVMAATRPEYNAKIRLASFMAPGALMAHQDTSSLYKYFKNIGMFEAWAEYWGVYEAPFIPLIRYLVANYCSVEEYRPLCAELFAFFAGGMDPQPFDWEMTRAIGTNTPAEASIRQVFHYGQVIRDNRFQFYDFGAVKNRQLYGSSQPPAYDLEKVTAPVAIYYGLNDRVAHFDDVRNLSTLLPNVVEVYPVPYKYFNHFGCLWARNAVDVLFKRVLEVMAKYKNRPTKTGNR